MKVQDVRIRIPNRPCDSDRGLLATASIMVVGELGRLGIQDLKIIKRGDGRLLLVMPSRSNVTACMGCGTPNATTANYCGHCGKEIERIRSRVMDKTDIVWMPDAETRLNMEAVVFDSYWKESERLRLESGK